MKEYRNAGIVLIAIAVVNFAYVLARVLFYGDSDYIPKQNVWGFELQCSASMLCLLVAGYFLGINAEKEKASVSHPTSQVSSVQE